MGTIYRLYTHKHDPQGEWLDKKGNPIHIFGYDEVHSTQGSATSSTSSYNSPSVLPHPWLRANSKADYAGLIGAAAGTTTFLPYVFPADDGKEFINGSANAVDTSAGINPDQMTLLLPSDPVVGETIEIVDAEGTFDSVPLLLDGNGKNIEGEPNKLLDLEWGYWQMYWTGSQWVLQEEGKVHELHDMEWDTAAWTSAYSGNYAHRKQMWDGALRYYVSMVNWSLGGADGVVHELDGGTATAPNLDPTVHTRTFTKRGTDGVIEVTNII